MISQITRVVSTHRFLVVLYVLVATGSSISPPFPALADTFQCTFSSCQPTIDLDVCVDNTATCNCPSGGHCGNGGPQVCSGDVCGWPRNAGICQCDAAPPTYPTYPDYPSYPGYPGYPGYPSYPPSYPGYPSYPTYPSYPVYPTYPPSYPGYPTYPSYPVYPTYPNYPGYPTYPNYPGYPNYPSYPP